MPSVCEETGRKLQAFPSLNSHSLCVCVPLGFGLSQVWECQLPRGGKDHMQRAHDPLPPTHPHSTSGSLRHTSLWEMHAGRHSSNTPTLQPPDLLLG